MERGTEQALPAEDACKRLTEEERWQGSRVLLLILLFLLLFLLRRHLPVMLARRKSVTEEENGWTRVIDDFEGTSWTWTTELVSRALGNRGNARSRQGKLQDALEDYNRSIAMTPEAPDPLLNRGVLHETMRDFDLALQDYRRVLDLNPSDAAAYNNIGNTQMQIGQYAEAVVSLEKARALVSGGSFAFADTNLAMALFLSGDTKRSFSLFRRILTRYVR